MIIETYLEGFLHAFSREVPCWEYKNACVLLGAEALYQITEDSFYYDLVKKYVDSCLDDKGVIRDYKQQDYNLDNILGGRLLFGLYEKEHNEKYLKGIEILMEQIRNQPRTQSGNFWHKKIYPNQVWLDGLYMSLPFWARYDRTFGSGMAFMDIRDQIREVRRHLYCEEKGLYYHGWDESKSMFWADSVSGCSANIWLRAVGWHLMALIDVCELLDKEDAIRNEIISLWREALDGVLKYQDEKSGLFFQVVDLKSQPKNYLETSGSLMVAYVIFKGIRLGILDSQSYLLSGEKILATIEHRLLQEDGKLSLRGTCRGAGLGPDNKRWRDGSIDYYLTEPIAADEKKGAAVCMLAYAEWRKLTGKEMRQYQVWPEIRICQNYE